MNKEKLKVFMKEVDKTKKPKHWRKFINKNTEDHNIIIKYGKRAFCTHCQKYFDEDVKIHSYEKTQCKWCGNKFYVRNHNIRKFIFETNIGFFVKINGKIVLRVFEIESKYNYKTRKFTHTLQEFLRFAPGEGYIINNTFHFYFFDTEIDHSEKINSWRKYRGNKVLYNCVVYPYNKKYLYKDTPLEYAPIKEFKEKYKYYTDFEILNIANNKSFEYLWKMRLYNLSKNAKYFNKKGKFSKKFGVQKNFLPFMIENNINFEEYKILKLLQVQDMKVIKKYKYYNYNYLVFMKKQGYLNNDEILEKYKYYESYLKTICKYTTLKKFFQYKQGIENLRIYIDYINIANELGYSIKAKDRLFPKDLLKIHDELSKKIKTIEDKKTQYKVYCRYLELSKYTYDDGKYIIFPSPSVADFKDEGKQQDNCVATMYIKPYANKKTEIYFIRELNNMTKSFITLEYNNGIVQQKELPHHRKNFSEEQNNFIEKWCKFKEFIYIKEKYKKATKLKPIEYDLNKLVA